MSATDTEATAANEVVLREDLERWVAEELTPRLESLAANLSALARYLHGSEDKAAHVLVEAVAQVERTTVERTAEQVTPLHGRIQALEDRERSQAEADEDRLSELTHAHSALERRVATLEAKEPPGG
jgi:hypothetical protein